MEQSYQWKINGIIIVQISLLQTYDQGLNRVSYCLFRCPVGLSWNLLNWKCVGVLAKSSKTFCQHGVTSNWNALFYTGPEDVNLVPGQDLVEGGHALAHLPGLLYKLVVKENLWIVLFDFSAMNGCYLCQWLTCFRVVKVPLWRKLVTNCKGLLFFGFLFHLKWDCFNKICSSP